MNFSRAVKHSLLEIIRDMACTPSLFVRNPGIDFTRKRKLDFETMLQLLLSMEGASMGAELLEFFDFSLHTPTVSAFNQQRGKILPDAFKFLFHEFNQAFPDYRTFKNYRLIACDGSDLNIAANPADAETYCQSSSATSGFNQLHLNALYDLCSRKYVDALVQGRKIYNESQAMIDMVERYSGNENTIFIADRGYETYNLFAHIEQKNMNYLIRVKDIKSNGMLSAYPLPKDDCFDVDINLIITRKQTKETKANPQLYKILPNASPFDYTDLFKNRYYPITIRVVRFPISDHSYECIVTNLDRDEFCVEHIKEIYRQRWGIETSFRELKYAIGMTAFHSKKVEYILQEIYARLTLYNFCEIITTKVVLQKKQTKHEYQLNYTMAIQICRYYLRICSNISPPDVEALIQKYLLPIRNGRSDPRKVKPRRVVSFLYRVA